MNAQERFRQAVAQREEAKSLAPRPERPEEAELLARLLGVTRAAAVALWRQLRTDADRSTLDS